MQLSSSNAMKTTSLVILFIALLFSGTELYPVRQNSTSTKEDIQFKLELKTANVTTYHERMKTQNCTIEVVGNAQSKYAVEQQKDFLKVIEILIRINGHLSVDGHKYNPRMRSYRDYGNWFWAKSSQEAFVNFYTNIIASSWKSWNHNERYSNRVLLWESYTSSGNRADHKCFDKSSNKSDSWDLSLQIKWSILEIQPEDLS